MASSSFKRGLSASPYAATPPNSMKIPTLGHEDKENCSQLGSQSRNKPSALQPLTKTSSTTRTIHSQSRSTPATSSKTTGASPSATLAAGNASPVRVLRYGETMESLFLLHATSSDEYRKLCLTLIHDSNAAQDPNVWSRVLEMAVEQERRHGTTRLAARAAPDLIRLHRRATSRFPLTPDTLPLWLSYAKVQVHNKSDALLTLRHVARVGKPMASYYVTKADLHLQWGQVEEATKTLQEGIEQKAQPLTTLTEELEAMKEVRPQKQESSSHEEDEEDDDDVTEPINNMPANHSKVNQRTNDTRKDLDNHPIELAKTPNALDQRRPSIQVSKASVKGSLVLSTSKRPPLNNSKLLQRSAASILMQPNRLESGLAILEDPINEEAEPQKSETPIRKPEIDVSYIKAWDPTQPRRKSCEATSQPQKASSPVVTEHLPPINESVMEQGNQRTPGATRAKPKVDVSSIKAWQPESHRRKSSENSATKELHLATPNGPVSKAPRASHDPTQSTTRKTKQPPIPRLDLSYMLEWDPTKRRPSMTTEPTKDVGAKEHTVPSLSSSTGSLEVEADKKESPKESDDTENQQNATIRAGKAHPIDTDNKGPQTCIKRKIETENTEVGTKRRRSVPANHDETSPAKEISPMEGYNKDFLSLARQENMLIVNRNSYMKIGVVGKGGSCKVYRALSKDGHVLAIKKVKLAGLKQETIEGYANEIALLQRLRGSPAIIQLYDSQIDIDQKAILLVMEAGEADLNHVLHQQTLLSRESSGHTTRPRLDMNFIRVTWQQMLKAVHCIHEERIVHGDLKPANFLFVRGALKLIDFGIAKAIQGDDTTNIVRDNQIGTVNYMSPESLVNQTGDRQFKMGRASDIWSLGCILYQMIYGKTPFADLSNIVQKLQAISNPKHEIAFPTTTDESAVDCMKQCLRYKADERPPIVGPNGLLNEHPFLNAHR